jgi:hypothetical protein
MDRAESRSGEPPAESPGDQDVLLCRQVFLQGIVVPEVAEAGPGAAIDGLNAFLAPEDVSLGRARQTAEDA